MLNMLVKIPNVLRGLTFKVKFNLQTKIYPIMSLVHVISHHQLKLEPPNSDKKSKAPWLRSLLFFVLIGLNFQGKI